MNRPRTSLAPEGRTARLLVSVLLVAALVGCAGGLRPALWRSGALPTYPESARAANLTGYVKVVYGVTVDGRVVNLRVLEADPVGVFEASALAAVRSWRYRPARQDGQPVAVAEMVSTLRFSRDTDAYKAY